MEVNSVLWEWRGSRNLHCLWHLSHKWLLSQVSHGQVVRGNWYVAVRLCVCSCSAFHWGLVKAFSSASVKPFSARFCRQKCLCLVDLSTIERLINPK